MKSLVGALLGMRNAAPVPYVAQDGGPGFMLGSAAPRDRGRTLGTMASSGTVFSIVNRTSTSTAAVEWHMHRTGAAKTSVCPVCEKPGVVLLEEHLALRIWNKPNDFYTRQELVETGQQHNDLTGETWLLVERNSDLRGLPLGLWPVRPDRMEPIPSKEQFLTGYIYRAPGGERIPLGRDEVIMIRQPDPEDPYRGLGAIQAALRDVDSGQLAAEYNRNFFLNSAEPGGVIEAEKLSDAEFEKLRMQWGEQHRGVSRAHRVAILEGAKWVDRKYTHRDMEFASLRTLSRDSVREAFGMPKFALGDVDDVNRATADASSAWFAQQVTVPRLERWRLALNNDFLPMFGSTGKGVEFAYSNPVPPDRDSENAERDSKTQAWATLVGAGADPADAAQIVGLPPIRVIEKPVPTVVQSAREQFEPENALRWVADEKLDDDTCEPCRKNHGKTYRNREDAYADYPGGGGYRDCDGRDNCRGRVVKRGK